MNAIIPVNGGDDLFRTGWGWMRGKRSAKDSNVKEKRKGGEQAHFDTLETIKKIVAEYLKEQGNALDGIEIRPDSGEPFVKWLIPFHSLLGTLLFVPRSSFSGFVLSFQMFFECK